MTASQLLSNSEIRKGAKGKLKGNWVTPIGALILYLVIVIASNFIPFIGVFINIIFASALGLGFAILYLNLIRTGSASFGDMFKGFNYLLKAILAYFLMTIFILLWTLLLIIPGIIASIKYSQTFFIIADNPDIKAIDAIKESKRMMEGNKWKYFTLQLSFIGWALLSVLTLGIGFLWLTPYMYTSYAIFYEDLKGDKVDNVDNVESEIDSPIKEI